MDSRDPDGWRRLRVLCVDDHADSRDLLREVLQSCGAAVLEAEGIKQSQILQSEGKKQSEILKAEGDAQARVTRANAEAEAIRLVSTAAETFFRTMISISRSFRPNRR